jgi:ATP synthase protein I
MPFLPPDQLKTIGALSTLGLSFVFAIAIGVAAGLWIDRSFGTSPFGFFLFFLLGLAAGVVNVYRVMSRIK